MITSNHMLGPVALSLLIVLTMAPLAAASCSHVVYTSMKLERNKSGGDGAVVARNNAKAKASSDGQDLLTPMVERAAETIANAVAR